MDAILMNFYDRGPRWKTSVVLSLMVHVLLVLAIIFMPHHKEEKEKKPFFARIVSPDELRRETPPPTSSGKAQKEAQGLRGPSFPVRPASPPRLVKPQVPQTGGQRVFPSAPAAPSQPKESDKGADMGGQTKSLAPLSEGPVAIPGTGRPREGGIRPPGPAVPTLREKLFDREVVEKLARREEPKQDSSVTFDAKEFRYYSYMMKLKERIERIWRYPPDAAMKGLYGDLYISFTILKNGKLGSVELVRTSGHRSLDDAAMQALKDAQPFWPLPEDWGRDSLDITGHFIYSMYGTYIR